MGMVGEQVAPTPGAVCQPRIWARWPSLAFWGAPGPEPHFGRRALVPTQSKAGFGRATRGPEPRQGQHRRERRELGEGTGDGRGHGQVVRSMEGQVRDPPGGGAGETGSSGVPR